MDERNFSCMKRVVKTVQVPLPAAFISNEKSGIAEILDSWKRQYLKQLQGVVVNYKHYSLSSPTGFIAPNKPVVYYNVKATFDLFCPKVGDVVKGKINRISKEHIGCLIEDTINVTIHLTRDSPAGLAPFIGLNRQILFEIASFNFDRKMIRVKGKITSECIQLMKDLFPPIQTFGNLVDTPELSNNTDEGIGTGGESADDRVMDRSFDVSESNNDDANFKKPFSSSTKSKKKSSKRRDSESSSMDTSDASTSDEKPKKKKHGDKSSSIDTSDEKPKKKKNKHDKSNLDLGNLVNGNNPSSETVSCDSLIQNFSSFNHSQIVDAIKEEELSSESNAHAKKRKKKKKQDLSPSLIHNSAKSNNYSLIDNASSLNQNLSTKSSKKRKRESESSFMDTSEQSTADEMPKKHKDKIAPFEGKEVKTESFNDKTDTAAVLSVKKEIFSPVETDDNVVPESKKNKKNKRKKLKGRNASKKSKVHASGAVLKKDKKSQKKGSKKSGEQSKKHKKSKGHKKDEKDKKKKKSSKNKVSDVIKSEID